MDAIALIIWARAGPLAEAPKADGQYERSDIARWVRTVSIGPFGVEVILLAFDQHFRATNPFADAVRGVDGKQQRFGLAAIGTKHLILIPDSPFSVGVDDEIPGLVGSVQIDVLSEHECTIRG